ncbi:unnamed protein product [Pleuronectes platessa]|uniref:Ig-like domain-containing protein n=1 Tax=Pleuronectes platessa TaxID=8262 RepID=A0A9N7UD25_PLEPL|nr:unnamed protein product [Pleuronectes platessa]
MFYCLRRSLWVIVLYELTTVSCQLQVKGQAGDDVLLPCIYGEDDPLPQKVSHYWRDQDDAVVLDSNLGVPDPSSQSPTYRGRVDPAPQLEGDFSIVLKQVGRSDSGVFECHVPEVDFMKSVQLTVTDKLNVVMKTQPPGSNAAATRTRPPLLLLPPLLLSLYCVV